MNTSLVFVGAIAGSVVYFFSAFVIGRKSSGLHWGIIIVLAVLTFVVSASELSPTTAKSISLGVCMPLVVSLFARFFPSILPKKR